MDDYMDMGCDDYFDTHDVDDLMEWENEQVFQDTVAERNEYDFSCDLDYDDCDECEDCA
jgi:hypothetical protein